MSGGMTTETGKRIDVLPQLQYDWIAEASFYSITQAARMSVLPETASALSALTRFPAVSPCLQLNSTGGWERLQLQYSSGQC
jgi:hypothetical protein